MSQNRFYQYTYQNARQDVAMTLEAFVARKTVLNIDVCFVDDASNDVEMDKKKNERIEPFHKYAKDTPPVES